MQASKPVRGFSADTEILTRHHGWLPFNQIRYLDEVAARDEAGRFRWQLAQGVTWKHYDGPMVRLHGKGLEIIATPDQPMLWVPHWRDPDERFNRAVELLERDASVPHYRSTGCLMATSKYEVPDFAGKYFPGIRRTKMGPQPKSFTMGGDQYAAFMGMYIAEGNVGDRGSSGLATCIAQMKYTKGFDVYRDLLIDIFGREPSYGGHQWQIFGKALFDYLQPLGHARSKYLPPEVLDLSRRQLDIFWQYYFMGDGNYMKNARNGDLTAYQAAKTASTALAGHLQEVAQKRGLSASMRTHLCKPTYLVRSANWVHRVHIRKTTHLAFRVTQTSYTGMIGNLHVTSGAIYVRRNGDPVWVGSA